MEALALQIPVVVSSLAASSIFTDDIVYIADDSSLDSYITAFNRLLSDYFLGCSLQGCNVLVVSF